MMSYNLKLAWLSMKRNPILSGLIVGAIGLGTGVFMILFTAYHLLELDPIPHKSHLLYRVMLDSWSPDGTPMDGMFGDIPPTHLTYMDTMNIVNSDIPTYQSPMMLSRMYLKSSSLKAGQERPIKVSVRASGRDFFPMFDTPFLYGGPWSTAADLGPEPVVVISKAINDRLFQSDDSVGETLLLNGNLFRVVGVLDDWRPLPLFYNMFALGFGVGLPEDVFIPFGFFELYQLQNTGMDNNWKASDPGFENWLVSESVWVQYWVQLDTPEQKQQYQTYLDNYALDQKKIGRFQRPLNNVLMDVPSWLKTVTLPLNGPSLAFLVLGILYLFVCVINLVGILLGKFIGRMNEVSIRRALGAPRSAIFTQHIIEVGILGIAGGIVGLSISQLALYLVRSRFSLHEELFALDTSLLVSAIVIACLAGLGAGLLPAWRACSTAPAVYLKAD